MAQIKLLKIGTMGFPQENESSDDITFATVTGVTQVGVTGGVTITSDITFNAATDLIAGIENQNLLDKTAAETISGVYTFGSGATPTIVDAPVNNTDAVNKEYVDSLNSGISWQEPVLDKDLSAPPGSPSVGDRYIVNPVGTGAWAGQDNNIAEWDGSAWQFTVVAEGFAAYVDDEDVVYIFNGTSWVRFSSITQHNNLSGLQGGTTGEYYHMTLAEDGWLADALSTVPLGTSLIDRTGTNSFTGTLTNTGRIENGGGELQLPSAVSAVPQEGDVYWDGVSDTLFVFNGSIWQDVSSSGTANSVQTVYTAGVGGIAQYDPVYISGADTVLPADASAVATAKVIGFAPNAILATNQGQIQEDGALAGILGGGGSAGTPYYLSTTAGTISTTRPTGAGEVVFLVGYAKNANDLQIQLQFIGIRS